MNRKLWAAKEIKFLLVNYRVEGLVKCARILGRSHSSVKSRANRVLGLSTYRRSYKHNERFFEEYTPQSSYCAGLLMADGNLYQNKGRNQVSLHVTDEELIKIFVRCVKYKSAITRGRVKGCKDDLRVVLSGKRVSDAVKNLWGIKPRKSCREMWPGFLPVHLKYHFLRGYLDGDGCVTHSGTSYKGKVYKYLRVEFNGGRDFLKSMREFLERDGIRVSSVRRVKGDCYRLKVSRKESLRVLFEKMYGDSEQLRLTRKYEQFEKYI